MTAEADTYTELRSLMFSIAYRMVGSVSEAEDIVQEAFLRHHRALQADTAIEEPRAYLSAITTRLAIDYLRSARVRRESYVGTWLPEPLLTDPAPGPGERAELAESLSLAFLVVLERLSPVERAVFLLREVFAYPYDEIAAIVGRSEDNCRQLAVRARRHVEEHRPRFAVSPERRDELMERFLLACETGDADALVGMLAADVVAYADGGGKVRAPLLPILGREKVVRFLLAVTRRTAAEGGVEARPAEVNGERGRLFVAPDGALVAVLTFDADDDAIRAIRIVANPEKLRHIS